jgi:hypothetical protein
LADDSTGVIAIVEQGRKHIEEHFSLQTQLQKLGQIYASLASDQVD